METKPIQLAHLYKNGEFLGYGLAVDGVLLDKLISTEIKTSPGERPRLEAAFIISNEIEKNPVNIDVSDVDQGQCSLSPTVPTHQ